MVHCFKSTHVNRRSNSFLGVEVDVVCHLAEPPPVGEFRPRYVSTTHGGLEGTTSDKEDQARRHCSGLHHLLWQMGGEHIYIGMGIPFGTLESPETERGTTGRIPGAFGTLRILS